jgi:hypothetical protein
MESERPVPVPVPVTESDTSSTYFLRPANAAARLPIYGTKLHTRTPHKYHKRTHPSQHPYKHTNVCQHSEAGTASLAM